jgi:hypothetical protein
MNHWWKKSLTSPFIWFIIPWIIYFGLVWFNAIQIRSDGWYAAYLPHWSDGAAHLSYISSFAFRDTFPTTHPLFENIPFSYSFAADMIAGYLVKAGVSLVISYSVIGFILSLASLVGLYCLLYSITKSNPISLLGLLLFLWGGGLGFIFPLLGIVFSDFNQPSPASLYSLLTQHETQAIVWLNPIVGELIPQRAFLLAFPLASLVLIVLHRWLFLNKPISLWLLFLSGIIVGLFPIIHPHTLMIITSLFATLVVRNIFLQLKLKTSNISQNRILQLIIFAAPASIIGSMLIMRFIAPVASGFITWQPGWLAPAHQTNWLFFWLLNWGTFLILALLGTIRSSFSQLKLYIFFAWGWFIATNLFSFQPFDWDNSKLLTWVYILLAIPAADVLIRLYHSKKRCARLVSISLFIITILSGCIDSVKMLNTTDYTLKMVSVDDIRLAQTVIENTPSDSVFLTATSHLHWVPMLTGRQILAGYLGWIWTYGIDYSPRISDIKAIYRGAPQAHRLIQAYSLDYIVLGPHERSQFSINHQFFEDTFPIWHQTPSTTIYAVTDQAIN